MLILTVISCGKHTTSDELVILNNFYMSKSDLIQAHLSMDSISINNYENLTKNYWEKIIQAREKILSLLIGMEDDTSYSIYGKNYIQNKISKKRIPNNLHALYLIECIIRDDYLFNRRRATNYPYLQYFKLDCLNFIYDTTKPPELSYNETTDYYDFHKNDIQLEEAWKIYKNWYYSDYIINKKLKKSPLDSTKYRWYSFINMEGGKAVYSNLNELESRCSQTLTNLGQRYHLDFKIGNGWAEDE